MINAKEAFEETKHNRYRAVGQQMTTIDQLIKAATRVGEFSMIFEEDSIKNRLWIMELLKDAGYSVEHKGGSKIKIEWTDQ